MKASGVLIGRELGGSIFAGLSFVVVNVIMSRLGRGSASDSSVAPSESLAHIANGDHVQGSGADHINAADKYDHDYLSYWGTGAGSCHTCVKYQTGHQFAANRRHPHVPAWVATDYGQNTPDASRQKRSETI
eukprot:4668266-Prymnesium_polylepis.1